MPPKNMISVTRNSHIPSDAEFFCWVMSAKWCRSAGLCSVVAALVCNRDLRFLDVFVVVGFEVHHRCLVEIECGRRRRSHPLEPSSTPWIVRSRLPVSHRPHEIDERQNISHAENR